MQRVQMQIQRRLGLRVIVDLPLGHRQRAAAQEVGAYRAGIHHGGADTQLGHFRRQRFRQP
ncbi:hypothetical protein D3C71_1728860 [compost metagenome]